MGLNFDNDPRLTAKQRYEKAYSEIRRYRQSYQDSIYVEYMPYAESLEYSIEEGRLNAIETAAAQSYLRRFGDELEAREIDKTQAEAFGGTYMWAVRK